MRILFANNLCGHYGGVEQVIAHTARELTRRGHTCHLAYGAARPDADDFSQPFASTAPCVEFRTPGAAAAGRSFREITGDIQPDVVFFHKVAHLPEGVEHERGYRKVVLVHDHDLWCPTGLGYLRHNRRTCRHAAGWRCYLALAFLEKAEGSVLPVKVVNLQRKIREMARYHHFDAILPNSTFIQEKLRASGFPGAKMRLCHPILNHGDAAPTPVPSAPEILYVGSLIRGKGVDLLLHALHRLRCPFHLNIAGTGKSQEELQGLAQSLGLAERVTFLGWVPNDAVAGYYQQARVVAVPSCWPEPFGLVGLEAMRHGRPVVAFNVGGIPDWLAHEDTGLMAPEQDVPVYAAMLERLLTDDTLARRLGENGARRAGEAFSFSAYVDALEGHLAGHEAMMRHD